MKIKRKKNLTQLKKKYKLKKQKNYYKYLKSLYRKRLNKITEVILDIIN